MLRHLSPEAEKVIHEARQIARAYQREYVGTEHVLLALARLGAGLVGRIFQDHALTEQRLRAEVDRVAPQSCEETWILGQLPGTLHLRNVVTNALESAKRLHCPRVETEHLLLGLLAEEHSVSHVVLGACGLDISTVRKQLADQVRNAREKR